MSKNQIKWGADPEMSAAYEKDGKLFSLPPVYFRTEYDIPTAPNGTHPIFADYDGTLVHEDGAAFEISTPPQTDWRVLWNTIRAATVEFNRDVVSQLGPDVCLSELQFVPTIGWDVDRWLSAGPEFHMSTIFGCDPDKDVYNMRAKSRVLDAAKHPFRYNGGHIHASGIPEIAEKPLIAIRSMVMTAGVAATAFSDVPELEKGRLFLYGRPGKYRIQQYKDGTHGIEYRTPSCRWVSDFQLAEKVFGWAEIGLRNLLQDGLFDSIYEAVEKDAVDSILKCDQEQARGVLSFIESKL